MKSPTVNPAYAVKADISYVLTIISVAVELLLLYLVTHTFLPEGKNANTVIFWVNAIPLLVFLPLLLIRNIKAFAWLSFLIMLYFIIAVMNAFDPRYGVVSQLELATVCLIFIFSMLFTRYEQRRLGITITPKDGKSDLGRQQHVVVASDGQPRGEGSADQAGGQEDGGPQDQEDLAADDKVLTSKVGDVGVGEELQGRGNLEETEKDLNRVHPDS